MLGIRRIIVVSLFSLVNVACATAEPGIWRPYPAAAMAASAQVGWYKNDRFPDIEIVDPNGVKRTISDYRGKFVFVNFWATWCPPCRKEWPAIQSLHDKLGSDDVAFLMLNMYEPYETGRDWARKQGFTLLPSNSYSRNSRHAVRKEQRALRLADGSRVDYEPMSIPHTFVLDRNGLILARDKANYLWDSYEPVFRDAIQFAAPRRR